MVPLYIVLGFVVAGVIVLFAVYYSRRMKMTSYTTGEVVRSQERVVRDEHERREETVVEGRYSVRGKQYPIELIVRGKNAAHYPVGKKLTVYYNPNIPEMSRVAIK